MPRRNLFILFVVALLSLVCYQKVQTNRYGHSLLKVFDLVERRYVEPIEGQTLFEGAVEGMVGCLDPNSSYFSAKDYETFLNGIKQQFGGVGMEVIQDPQTKQLTVVSPVFGSPAYEKGIRSGDRILTINGRNTQGAALEDLVALMRGEPGTQVVLSVLHEGEDKPTEVTIVRAIIEVDSVLGDTRNPDGTWNYFLAGYDKIGYLRLTAFGDKTSREMAAALAKLNAGGMKALILDLRNDPGGRLDAAVDVCDMFINSGEIVTTRSRGGQIKRRYTAHSKSDFRHFPMAVLVNRYSASASEIVAACLQDHRRAVIVGERTFGKGTVQELIELDEGQGALKLTTASYWRPSGRDINKPQNAPPNADWGVAPNAGYQVALEGQDLVRWSRWRAQRDGRKSPDPNGADNDLRPAADPPLLKALEYVEQALAKPAAGE